MIKLYGIPLSNNVNKVRYCLNFLKLPYEMIPINPLEGQNQTPEYTNLCPTAKIPAIEIDDLKHEFEKIKKTCKPEIYSIFSSKNDVIAQINI